MNSKPIHSASAQASCDQASVSTSQDHTVVSVEQLRKAGISIADWARERGFSPRLVYVVLKDGRKCLRGESFRIAKELGMKK
jgi:gp16 family phage-associated protein